MIKVKNLMLMYQIQVRKMDFFPYDYLYSFEKFKEGLPSKDKFYDSLTNRAINGKSCGYVLNV